MNSVFIVMGNDYPDAAFSTSEAAKAYCERKRAEDRALIERGVKPETWPGLQWRVQRLPHHIDALSNTSPAQPEDAK